MNKKEQILAQAQFLSDAEIIALSNSLQRSKGEPPSEEELTAVCNWAISTRVEETIVGMCIKGLLDIEMVPNEDGELEPNFKNSVLGKSVKEEKDAISDQLTREGGDILRDMLEDENGG